MLRREPVDPHAVVSCIMGDVLDASKGAAGRPPITFDGVVSFNIERAAQHFLSCGRIGTMRREHERIVRQVFGWDASLSGDFMGELRLEIDGEVVANARTFESLLQEGQRGLSQRKIIDVGEPTGCDRRLWGTD